MKNLEALRKQIESIKTSIAIDENSRDKMLNDLHEMIKFESIEELPGILHNIESEISEMEEKKNKLETKLIELLRGANEYSR